VPGIYISYPFCSQKCTFCNFASGVQPEALAIEYLDALVGELAATAWPWKPETIYLGGGTPSHLGPAALARLLAAVPGRPWREATIEAAPGTINRDLAAGWAEVGINRVSLGVQSFSEAELRGTGRRHTAAIVEDEISTLRSHGLDNLSIDLIAGLPRQTASSWRKSLDWIERLAVPHVSVYMLEVDEDSRLGNEILRAGPRYGAGEVPSESAIVDFYEEAVDRLDSIGLARYEISNFARPGFESVHNLKYWRLEPYLGFGADAHSCQSELRWQNVESAAEYVARFRDGVSPVLQTTPAIPEEEYFFLGLRQMAGVEATPGQIAPFRAAVERLIEEGLIEYDNRRLKLTRRGVLLSNDVFGEFIQPCPKSST
jgi:oxygen-independent coproporphyrinogen-3 oxidase